MQRANELCGHIKTLLHERALSELTLYACDFCGGNTIIDNFEDFIEVFGDTLPWDDIDINDFTWDDSRDLYGILREYNHHGGIFVQIVRQIRSVDGDLVFKIERRCFISFEEIYYHEGSEELSLEQLIDTYGEEDVAAHLEKIYRTLTSAEWLFELNNMKRS
jgi:hypothetical protein